MSEIVIIRRSFTTTRRRGNEPDRNGSCEDYRGYLQADAYVAYDSFFTDPARGMVEVGCMAHARRHVYQAREYGPGADGCGVWPTLRSSMQWRSMPGECGIRGEQLRLLREQASRPVLEQLHAYLLRIGTSCFPRAKPVRQWPIC